MESCIFSSKCQFARYGLDTANVLQEHEFSLTNDWFISCRKFASVQTNVAETCGESCPVWAVTEFLLRKNNLLGTNVMSRMTRSVVQTCDKIIEGAMTSTDSFVTYIPQSISCNEAANLLTYYGICTNWRGSAFSTVVYNLNFSTYINEVKKSWNNSNLDKFTEFDYIRSIIEGKVEGKATNILILSGIEFVNFKDFACEQMFDIINCRQSKHLPLIIVSPEASNIVGEGPLFGKLAGVLNEHRVTNV